MNTPILPTYQRELLEQGQTGNAALFFARMTQWWWDKEKDKEKGKKLEAKYQTGTDKKGKPLLDSSIVLLGKQVNTRFQGAEAALAAIHDRQTGFLGATAHHAGTTKSGLALEIRARLTAPFVSGLGSGHPTETGLILDRNSGLPYIPASSIKGVLRLACALYIAETDPAYKDKEDLKEIPDDHPLLRRYFGDTDTGKADGMRGQLVFLDAFPAEIPDKLLKADIMNPHFGQYYSGAQGPLETENPIPVKFLAVAPGTEFVFRCFASPLPERKPDDKDAAVFRPFGEKDEETVVALFKRAFAQLGFGGKTSIGYGRFAEQSIKRGSEVIPPPPPKPWDSWLNELEDVKDWDKLKALIFDKPEAEAWRGENGVAQTVEALCKKVRDSRRKNWTAEQDASCAAWLQPAGIMWEPLSDLECLIWKLADYGTYKSKNIDLAALTLPEAQALQARLKEWKCNDKRARGDKTAHWKKLQDRIRELKP